MSNNDIPAFPRSGANWTGQEGESMGCDASLGMTLRDYFAAKAMQGLLASEVQATSDEFATNAYAVADAMLKAREESK